MDAKHVIMTYLRSYWKVIAILLIVLIAYNAFACWAHARTITPQEAYDHIYNLYPGNEEFAEYVRDRCEKYSCQIDGGGSLIIKDP